MARFSTYRSAIIFACAALFLVNPLDRQLARADEIIVRNDSLENFNEARIFGGFIAGEEGGAWLTSPCNGSIVAVQIMWLAGLPGSTPHLGNNIWIREAGDFPVPGAVMERLDTPVLQAGGLNEFRFTDEFGTVPLDVPVVAGQTFSVTLEFGEATHPDTGSVVRDIDGCQIGKNVLFASNWDAWVDFCVFLFGDLVFRAAIECVDPTGACCQNNATCLDDAAPDECTGNGGQFQGPDTLCENITCPEPLQACCFLPDDCLNLQSSVCIGAGGFPQGLTTQCDQIDCFPSGACCLENGSCLDGVSPEQCDELLGSFRGNDSVCAESECLQPPGACCKPSGFCVELTEDGCDVIPNSRWAGMNTNCTDSDNDGVADDCMIECGDPPQDVDGDCDVDLDDFDQFLGCVSRPAEEAGPLCFCVDRDGDGDVDMHDYFDFANVFTGPGPGCP